MNQWTFKEGDAIAPGLWALRPLGGGHRYEAYVAHSDHLRALVVVKAVRPHLVADPATLAGLAGEADMLARLAHPMLLRGYGQRLDGDRPHLVLELIEGPRLSTVIRRFGMDIEQLLPLALNLCSVLHYLEREGVVHLDVKPRNIIMGGVPKLIDLSIARRVADLGQLRSPVGTDAYMAPEQRDPARFGELGPAADVWGLGATLREALGGRRAPAAIDGVIKACLEPEPRHRPTAGEVADVLEPLVGALPAPRIGRFRPRRINHPNTTEVHA
jgi:eukaryotic-like serine/threonine-protein kinase